MSRPRETMGSSLLLASGLTKIPPTVLDRKMGYYSSLFS